MSYPVIFLVSLMRMPVHFVFSFVRHSPLGFRSHGLPIAEGIDLNYKNV